MAKSLVSVSMLNDLSQAHAANPDANLPQIVAKSVAFFAYKIADEMIERSNNHDPNNDR